VDDFAVERSNTEIQPWAYVSLIKPTHVYDGDELIDRVPAPGDMLAYLTSHPALTALAPSVETTVGGRPAVQVDMTSVEGGTNVFAAGPTRFILMPDEVARFIVVDVDGEQIIIAAGALVHLLSGEPVAQPPGGGRAQFDAVLPEIEAIIASIEFR
jgi:hypothetical protein